MQYSALSFAINSLANVLGENILQNSMEEKVNEFDS